MGTADSGSVVSRSWLTLGCKAMAGSAAAGSRVDEVWLNRQGGCCLVMRLVTCTNRDEWIHRPRSVDRRCSGRPRDSGANLGQLADEPRGFIEIMVGHFADQWTQRPREQVRAQVVQLEK